MSFTIHDYNDLGSFTIGLWTKRHKEILSIFDLPRLQDAMQAFVELESADEDGELAAAAQDENNPDAAVMAAFERLYSRIFITLFDRGVLAHLIVVDQIPEGAQRQLDAMVAEVESHRSTKTKVQQRPVTTTVVEDPIAVCVRDFHELGSNAFKTKWVTNTRNRPTYDAAVEACRI
jgi:hypothetical protein